MNKSKDCSYFPKCFKTNDVDVHDDKDIANGFNIFFVNVGPNLAKNIPECTENSYYDYMAGNVNSSMFLEPTCENEIINTIKIFHSKSSSGYDGISMDIVKKIAQFISKPFSHICNNSFLYGIFPEKMKSAKVVPIFKSGNNQLFTNYRPVSLLPQFSKVLEKLFNGRLMSYINKNDILYNGQYGFRKNFSTSLAILDLIEEITTNVDKQQVTIGVFIDLKKAFDTIDHKILLNKMQVYGIRGLPLKWLDSYLSNRKQFVSFNDVHS